MYTVTVTNKETGEVVAVEKNVSDDDVFDVQCDWACDERFTATATKVEMVYCPSCGEEHPVPIERCKRFMREYQGIDFDEVGW